MKKLIFCLSVLYFLFGISRAEWIEQHLDLPFSPNKSTLVVGDARGDGTIHLYVGSVYSSPAYIAELTWNEGSSTWDMEIIDIDHEEISSGGITVIAIGDGRGDGKKRLYAGYYYTKKLCEFTWNGSSWTKIEITRDFDYYLGGITIGDGRNDGKNRLYVAPLLDPRINTSAPIEFTWTGSSWTRVDLLHAWYPEAYAPAMENHDNVTSNGAVYIGNFWDKEGENKIYWWNWEYSWSGSSWTIRYLPAGIWGEVKGDDVRNIYSIWEEESWLLYEWSFNGSTWTKIAIFDFSKFPSYGTIEGTSNLSFLFIGDAHNDGINRLYFRNEITYIDKPEDIYLYEVHYENGEWKGYEYPLYRGEDVAILADARNDGIKRVYTTGASILEYTWAYPQDPYDSTKTETEKLQPVNNYFRQGSGWTTIWYKIDKPGNVILKLYTIDGKLVNTLVDEYKTTGEYFALWTGRNSEGKYVASGIYLIHLEAPGISTTKKICVVK